MVDKKAKFGLEVGQCVWRKTGAFTQFPAVVTGFTAKQVKMRRLDTGEVAHALPVNVGAMSRKQSLAWSLAEEYVPKRQRHGFVRAFFEGSMSL